MVLDRAGVGVLGVVGIFAGAVFGGLDGNSSRFSAACIRQRSFPHISLLALGTLAFSSGIKLGSGNSIAGILAVRADRAVYRQAVA